MKRRFSLFFIFFVLAACTACNWNKTETQNQWSKTVVNNWYKDQGWIVGCNYIPSSAVNQLEMWQAETFDPELINKELGWAEELGFNSMRVYLHSLVWQNDSINLKKRISRYLSISAQHGIKTTFVFFDDCWNPEAQYGRQPEPKTGRHNSRWVQDPIVSSRKDTAALYSVMERYVKDILTTFKNDDRILMWDLYNEPGGSNHSVSSLPLLKKVFQWAREVNPSQPLTSGLFKLEFTELNRFQVNNSDVITYHCYTDKSIHNYWISLLKLFDKPLICTEWMARRQNCTFQEVLPLLKKEGVGAFSWGFVAGKTNTIYGWGDRRTDGKEPEIWAHDIIRKDGTPYSAKEIETIKSLTR